jgi:peptide/nickel transport system permease protein
MSAGEMFDGILSQDQIILISHYKNKTKRILRLYARNRSAMIGTTILTIYLLMAIFAPFIAPHGPFETIRNEEGIPQDLQPPSESNLLGTNTLAQDVFSQWVWGSRVSILVGILSGLVVVIVGGTVGLIAGYYRGNVDLVVMRIVDMLFAIPVLPFILLIGLFFGASVWNVILVMAVLMWRNMARVIRSGALSHAQRPYVKSARAAGASNTRIMAFHIAPNLLPLAVTEGTIAAGLAVTLEANISFLGFGAQDLTSWGSMLQLAFSSGAIRTAWWWVIPPGFTITTLVLSFFFIARGLEEVLNPEKEKGII